QVEAGRAILPLVVAIGDKGRDAVRHLIVSEDMSNDAVDRGIAATTLFVGHAAGIAEAGKDEAVDDMSELVLVARKPSQRSDRAGDEEKAIAVARPKRLDMPRQHRRDRDPREVVVGERGVADMTGKQDRVVALARYQQLAIAEVTERQIG